MSKHWKPTDKELAKIEVMATSNSYSYGDIAVELGVDVPRISYICKKNNWDKTVLSSNSYSEDIINNLLNKIYPDFTIKQQFHIGNMLRLDFFIYDYNIGIEYDGIQHEVDVEFFNNKNNSIGQSKARDYHKEIICGQLGINLIRFNTNDILNTDILYEEIEKIDSGIGSKELEIAKQFGGVVSSIKQGIVANQQKAKEYQKQKRKEFLKSDKYKEYLEKAKEYRKQIYQKRKDLKKEYDNKS